MKCILILFDEENIFENEKIFNGNSAKELCCKWAEKVADIKNTCVKIISRSKTDSLNSLLKQMNLLAEENDADYVVYSYADLPFVNLPVTEKMIASHEKFKSEYTFADGYSYGIAPEIIDKGTLGILSQLSQTTQSVLGNKSVKRDSLWELIKTDINSFDVESILSDKDYRLLRYSFDCSSRLNFKCCKELYKAAEVENNIYDADAEKICQTAENSAHVLKTVPSFYNLQICDGINISSLYSPYEAAYSEKFGKSPVGVCEYMALDKVFSIIEQAAELSEKAVIGLSLFGEPLNHPDLIKIIEKILSYPGLSLFIETDGIKVSEEFCLALKKLEEGAEDRTNGWQKIMIAVALDSFTAETYEKIHKTNSFGIVVNNINLLCSALPGCVYPQFTRMNQNEEELEQFYRYWSEKTNSSKGELIIQKYDDFAGLLPDYKPADLSPVDRNVCWHLRRDMVILRDGSVPLCRECLFSEVTGNIFSDGLAKVWKNNKEIINQLNKTYCKKCGKCDEYYTFNF